MDFSHVALKICMGNLSKLLWVMRDLGYIILSLVWCLESRPLRKGFPGLQSAAMHVRVVSKISAFTCPLAAFVSKVSAVTPSLLLFHKQCRLSFADSLLQSPNGHLESHLLHYFPP